MLDIPDELAPLSLEDDLKESAFAIYHRGVAKIQQEERRKFTETVQGILDDSNKTAHGKNKKAIEAIKDHAQWVFDEEKKLYRKRINDAIAAEKAKLALLITNIKAYAKSRVSDPA